MSAICWASFQYSLLLPQLYWLITVMNVEQKYTEKKTEHIYAKEFIFQPFSFYIMYIVKFWQCDIL